MAVSRLNRFSRRGAGSKAAPASQRRPVGLGVTLATTGPGVVVVFVSATAVTVAIPAVSKDLGASAAQSSWVLLSYLLTCTCLILPFGRMADLFDRRTLYLGGMGVFAVATVGCALSPTIEVLLAARALQEIGAAVIITSTTPTISDMLPSSTLARGLGWNAATAAGAQAVGPIFGGIVTSTLGWRYIFVAAVPLCVVGACMAMRFMSPPQICQRSGSISSGRSSRRLPLGASPCWLRPGRSSCRVPFARGKSHSLSW
ncbi:MFS transporter [Nocardioides pyridinolyticus]